MTRTLASEAREHLTYLVEALDPPTHTFEVRLVVKPSARLSLWFLTPYGQRLDLVRSSTTDEGCVEETDQIVCLQEFPALEARVEVSGRSTFATRRADPPPPRSP
jgi:hypothetical protein